MLLSDHADIGVQAARRSRPETIADGSRPRRPRSARSCFPGTRHPEHWEEVATNHFPIARSVRSPIHTPRSRRTVQCDTGEDAAAAREVPRTACGRPISLPVPGSRLTTATAIVSHLERPPRNRVEHREDRGIGADAERHRRRRGGDAAGLRATRDAKAPIRTTCSPLPRQVRSSMNTTALFHETRRALILFGQGAVKP